jgi:hypothetical protein
VPGIQAALGGVCGAKKGGLALHFGVESASESFFDVMKEYDFKKYADFSNVDSGYGTWAVTSCSAVHGLTKTLLNYGPDILSFQKTILNFKRV